MDKCNGKIPYWTNTEAEAACESMKATARKTGQGGGSWRRLNVYVCGHHFHIGRNNSMKFKPVQPKRIPSRGELKRKAKYWDEKLLKDLKHRLYVAGQKIEADARAEKAKLMRDYENALAAVGISQR